jgi:glycosyltransferase involved in cell wall biosynthesis
MDNRLDEISNMADNIRLSVVVIVYNMQRAAPRSLQALSSAYQLGVDPAEYEIIVVENGSPQPLDAAQTEALGPNFHYHYLADPPPSPAYAINYGVSRARGEVLAVMVDGAHILTPGVLRHALDMFAARRNPLVVTAPFFLGPGPQTQTIADGYSEMEEDRLLTSIDWPNAGYRLFEIGVPYRIVEDPETRPKLFWFVRQFESNCLFMRKTSFEAVGGCDERFDIPGGGMLLPDLYRQLCRLEDSEIIQLLGEASFHQIHGGVSTNTTAADQREKWNSYLVQYQSIRGEPFEVSKKPLQFYGHMPNRQASILMKTG